MLITLQQYLKKKKVLLKAPSIVKFKKKDGSFVSYSAVKTDYYVKYSDVLNAVRKYPQVVNFLRKKRLKDVFK